MPNKSDLERSVLASEGKKTKVNSVGGIYIEAIVGVQTENSKLVTSHS